MEQNRRVWNTLETTVSYKARARLTPTLTHVVTYELVTSGAEDGAMSGAHTYGIGCLVPCYPTPRYRENDSDSSGGTQLLIWSAR